MTAERFFGARKTWLGLSVGLSLSAGSALWPAAAHAQSSSDSATAQTLFDGAKALMKRGKFSEACPKLEESQRIDARSGTALNLADCYEHTGRLASAWSTFLEAATLAKATGNAAREHGARDRAAALVPRLSTLAISAPFATTTPDLRVTRDGEAVGEAQFGLAIPVNVGEHAIAARAPGRKAWQSTITVEGGASKANVEIPELENEAPPQEAKVSVPLATSTPVVDSPHAQPSRINGAVIAGGVVTGAFVVGTVVSGILYKSKLSDYNAANQKDDNESAARTLRSQTRTLGVVNLALLGAAVAAAGVTVVLWAANAPNASNASDESPASARVELRAIVSPGMTGLIWGGRL